MSTLNAAIKKEVPHFNQDEKHLEAALNDYLNCNDIGKIKRIIHENIIKADGKFLSEEVIKNKNNPIVKLINWVKKPHPCVANIITINYDRAIEYLLSYNAIPFTDGFTGRELSPFNKANFKEKILLI